MTKSEKTTQNDIIERIANRTDIRLFRNNVGVGFVGTVLTRVGRLLTLVNFRRIRFGLHTGSGDMIGWKSITVTPDMVGKKIAIFLSIETKRPRGGKISAEQKNWLDQVRLAGGIAEIIKNPESMSEI